ncbi:MAG: phosphatase PAP2 family protein [Hyphomicrobium sp.]|uniref:phosphatase PAP2 family protein n=1 Tax=Hyphomicrobium sp. TaxID=82 RepID=UPI0039E65C57
MGIMTAVKSQYEHRSRDASSNVSLLVWGGVIVGAIAALVFFLFPQIDLKTSELFYRGDGVFVGKGGNLLLEGADATFAGVVRLALYSAFVVICIITVAGIVASAVLKRDVFGLGFLKWLFLGACLLIGPGFISNVVLKDHWGRARPVHVTEFGGKKAYSPALVPSDQCRRNCSFIAGEAAMMYATFFAAAFLFPAIGRKLILTGAVVGFLSGLIRVSQGAHFLSDVIFAGVAMALTVAAIHTIFRIFVRTEGPDGDPLIARSP